jgi:sugar (pentulose or hexulose) kinase
VRQDNNYIAVDLGAESGRIMLGNVTNERLVLEEIYRFPNQPLKQNKTLRWDFNSILSNIKKGITEAVKYIRDWLYVYDHRTTIWKVLVEAEPGEIYNIDCW